MMLQDLFDAEFQDTLNDANSAMESLVMLANAMLTKEETDKLLEISRRIEQELQAVTDKKFVVRHFMFPTVR